MSKVCTKCKVEKELTEFHKDSKTKDGLFIWCKACNAMRAKKHYIKNKEKIDKYNLEWKKKNPEKYIEAIKKCHKKNAEINRAKIAEIHGTKCVHCGATESKGKQKVLELHHSDPNGKEFTVTNRLHYSWDKIEAEVKKCILLCAQCHRAEHVRMKELQHV